MNTDKDWSKWHSFIAGKASDKADASRLLGRRLGVVFVFASYSLRISFVFSWCSSLVLPGGLRCHHVDSAEPVPGFDSTGSVAIQTNSRSSFSICQPGSAALECGACNYLIERMQKQPLG